MRRYLLKIEQSMLFSTLLLAVALGSVSFGQSKPSPGASTDQTGQLYLISVVRVQLAAQREWETLIRNEYIPALRKAGVTQCGVWKSATLGNNGEYMIGRPIKDGAELDGPDPILRALGQDGDRALFDRLDRITTSVQTFLVTRRPDLSIAPASGYVLKLAGLTETSVAPGRTAEYEKAQKELLAVISKTNVKGCLVSRISGGGNPNQYNSLMLFDSFADMNQLGSAWRKAAGEANLAPPPGLVVHTERRMLRFVPELSIQPQGQKAAK